MWTKRKWVSPHFRQTIRDVNPVLRSPLPSLLCWSLIVACLFFNQVAFATPMLPRQSRLSAGESRPRLSPVGWMSRLAKKTHPPDVALQVKLVYASRQGTKAQDPRLLRDLPTLNHIYDFNDFRLMRVKRHRSHYGAQVHVSLAPRYRMSLRPLRYDRKMRKIAIRVTMSRQKRMSNGKPSSRRAAYQKKARWKAYFSVNLRLQDGGKIALVGPVYLNGRSLVILSAKKLR